MRHAEHGESPAEPYLAEVDRADRHLAFVALLGGGTSLALGALMFALGVNWLATVTGTTGIGFLAIAVLAKWRLWIEAARVVVWIITVGAIAVSALGAGRAANIQIFLLPVLPALFLIHPSSKQRSGLIGALGTVVILVALELYWLLVSPHELYAPTPPAWYGSVTPMLSLVLITLVTLYQRTRSTRLLAHLASAQTATEQAAGAQKRFVDQAAHDLRTPLHAIAGFSEKLRREKAPTSQLLDEIERATNLLGVIIDEILAYTAGTPLVTEATPVNLSEILRQTSSLLTGAGLDMTLHLPTKDVWILAEATRARHVIVAAIGEATANRQKQHTLRLHLGEGEDTCTLSIRHALDCAPADDTLTLQRARQWLEKMNGSLETKHNAYVLRFVRSSAPAKDSVNPGPLSENGGTVLAVDDNPVNLVLLSACLTELGVPYETAANGLLAVERWKRGGIALIFMDYSMPTLNGAQATTNIRALEKEGGHRRVPIVGVTANTEDSSVCLAAGMDEVVGKPFGMHKLRETLKQWNVRFAQPDAGQ